MDPMSWIALASLLVNAGSQTAGYLSREPEDYRAGASGLPSQFSQGGQQANPLMQSLMQRQQQAQMPRTPGYQMMRYF